MRRLTGLFFLILLLAAGWAAASLYLPYQGSSGEGVYVDIPHGASTRTIARMLAEQGVVRSRWVFEGLVRARRQRTLQAGEYFFNKPATSREVFDTIASGRVFTVQMQVPEGFTMFDIADLAEKQGFTTRDDFLAAARDPDLVHDIAPDVPTLEGFLFPATYEFPRHVSGAEIAAAMVKKFRQSWAEILAQENAGQQDKPAAEPVEAVVTLASLVERETPKPEERPEVAGVFAKRLAIGLPLQCDPTVVYALELAGGYSGRLGAADLSIESPYNTYRHRGLPPGPIANPGQASLRAALDPAATDYLYFVANTEGGHFFSKTYAEHNRNVEIYRKRLEQERREQAGGASAGAAAAKPHAQGQTP